MLLGLNGACKGVGTVEGGGDEEVVGEIETGVCVSEGDGGVSGEALGVVVKFVVVGLTVVEVVVTEVDVMDAYCELLGVMTGGMVYVYVVVVVLLSGDVVVCEVVCGVGFSGCGCRAI